MQVGSITALIRADSTQLVRGLKTATGSLNNFKRQVTIAATVVTGLSFKLVNMASEMTELNNVIDQAYGNSANEIRSWADDIAKSHGRANYEVRKFAGLTQSMLKPLLGATKQTEGMSKEITKFSIDLASFFDIADERAFNAIKSGLMGIPKPLQMLGISMHQATVQAYALKKGLDLNMTSLTQSEKLLLRYATLLGQTSFIQGDAVRTLHTFRNQMKKFQGNVDNLARSIGEKLTPMFTKALNIANDFFDGMDKANFVDSVSDMISVVTKLTVVLGIAAAASFALSNPFLAWGAVALTTIGTVNKALSKDSKDSLKGALGAIWKGLDKLSTKFHQVARDLGAKNFFQDVEAFAKLQEKTKNLSMAEKNKEIRKIGSDSFGTAVKRGAGSIPGIDTIPELIDTIARSLGKTTEQVVAMENPFKFIADEMKKREKDKAFFNETTKGIGKPGADKTDIQWYEQWQKDIEATKDMYKNDIGPFIEKLATELASSLGVAVKTVKDVLDKSMGIVGGDNKPQGSNYFQHPSIAIQKQQRMKEQEEKILNQFRQKAEAEAAKVAAKERAKQEDRALKERISAWRSAGTVFQKLADVSGNKLLGFLDQLSFSIADVISTLSSMAGAGAAGVFGGALGIFGTVIGLASSLMDSGSSYQSSADKMADAVEDFKNSVNKKSAEDTLKLIKDKKSDIEKYKTEIAGIRKIQALPKVTVGREEKNNGLFDKVVSGFLGLFGIKEKKEPEKKIRDYETEISTINAQIEAGWESLAGFLGLTMENFSSNIKNAFDTNTYGDFVKSFGISMKNTIRDAIITNFFANDLIKKPLEDLSTKLTQAITGGKDAYAGMVNEVNKELENLTKEGGELSLLYKALDDLGLSFSDLNETVEETTSGMQNLPSSLKLASMVTAISRDQAGLTNANTYNITVTGNFESNEQLANKIKETIAEQNMIQIGMGIA